MLLEQFGEHFRNVAIQTNYERRLAWRPLWVYIMGFLENCTLFSVPQRVKNLSLGVEKFFGYHPALSQHEDSEIFPGETLVLQISRKELYHVTALIKNQRNVWFPTWIRFRVSQRPPFLISEVPEFFGYHATIYHYRETKIAMIFPAVIQISRKELYHVRNGYLLYSPFIFCLNRFLISERPITYLSKNFCHPEILPM